MDMMIEPLKMVVMVRSQINFIISRPFCLIYGVRGARENVVSELNLIIDCFFFFSYNQQATYIIRVHCKMRQAKFHLIQIPQFQVLKILVGFNNLYHFCVVKLFHKTASVL